jgi:hypothetical protein
MNNKYYTNDGHTRPLTKDDQLEIGMVFRMVNSDGSISPFSDTVVISVNKFSDGSAQVKLARPYGFATSKIRNLFFSEVETFETTDDKLMKNYQAVLTASGKFYIQRISYTII